jgi:hypothetical protein
MKSEDVHLVHKLWLDVKQYPGTEEIHHSDIVTLALTRLARDYNLDRDTVLKTLRRGARGPTPKPLGFVREPSSEPPRSRVEEPKRDQPMPPVTGPK